MSKTTKLELTWIGKENRPRLEPRILMEDAGKSYHAKTRVSGDDIFDNELIFGDNLLALKALEQKFAGRIKCVYIDPPYNTGTAFAQYDDGLEHSLWLSLMRDRLEILSRLLRDDGSLWINIDDNEAHYLKVICDEVFGRPNFIANVVWQKRLQPEMRATIGAGHDHILVYAKDRDQFKEVLNLLEKSQDRIEQYRNPDNDPRGPWVSADFMAKGYRPNQMYKITTPSGAVYEPRPGSCWRNIESVYKKLHEEGRIWYGKDGSSMPRKKTYLSETEGHSAWSWWPNSEVGHNQEAKKESNALFGVENAFETPKPERLIRRVIEIATDEGDFVLDSFAGSGTTGAVAHKMRRRWIMIELGDHCHTHIIPRLRKVIEGTDKGGITEAVEWKVAVGSAITDLRLLFWRRTGSATGSSASSTTPPCLQKPCASSRASRMRPATQSTGYTDIQQRRDFIYVTTQTLTREQLQKLSDEVGENRSLLVCCSAFRVKDVSQFPNLTIKKIPKMVLNRCEWGRDDYSLEIKNLPQGAPASELVPRRSDQRAQRRPRTVPWICLMRLRRGAIAMNPT